VFLDKDKAKWKEAIAKDNQVGISNLKFGEELSIEAIPATFILDASGNVVARGFKRSRVKSKSN
jgi:hypothetical protein